MVNDPNALYAELKSDIQLIADPLFDFSEQCLNKRGNFLPHGAVLTESGEVKLIAAMAYSAKGTTSSAEVLPLLHEGLRKQAQDLPIRAVGVAENVTVTPEGQSSTQAIKVLIEHRRRLTVALYLPFKKRLLRGYEFGATFSIVVEPEVRAWQLDAT